MPDSPPTLLSAARELLAEHDRWFDSSSGPWVALRSAIAAEEARLAKEGTVERVEAWVPEQRAWRLWTGTDPKDALIAGAGWKFYAERPLPPPKPEPSLVERLESEVGPNHTKRDELFREAAAELRRLKGERA